VRLWPRETVLRFLAATAVQNRKSSLSLSSIRSAPEKRTSRVYGPHFNIRKNFSYNATTALLEYCFLTFFLCLFPCLLIEKLKMQYGTSRSSIVVRCPNAMRDQLKEIAGREGETVSTVVRRLIVSVVNRAKNGETLLCGSEARN
jgi:hypothetical protein